MFDGNDLRVVLNSCFDLIASTCELRLVIDIVHMDLSIHIALCLMSMICKWH